MSAHHAATLSTPRRPFAKARHAALSPAPLFFAALGVAGMAALWVLVATFLQRHSAWMAVMAAADIALLLRIAEARPGWPRAALCMLATAATVVGANWGIAGTRTGQAFGYGPLESLRSLGPELAWTLAELGNHGTEFALYAAALVVAWWLGR